MGKAALVTGSSRGIGKAVILELANSGYRCVVNYNKSEKEAFEVVRKIRNRGGQAIACKADVRDSQEVKNMFLGIKRHFGGIDLLVNNAGIATSMLFQNTDEKQWLSIIDTNVNGMYYCTKEAIDYMLENKSGNIINIASIWGIIGGAMEVAYSTSKGAVLSFTKALAKEVGYSGIRVNCIAPGGGETDMLKPLGKEILDAVIDETPVGRLGRVEDIANLVNFLASEKSEFITGQIISPNGGFTII